MAKRRIAAEGDQGFTGLDATSSPSRLGPGLARLAINSDHSRSLMLLVRPGSARSTLAKQASGPRAVLWFKDRSGVDRMMYELTGSGLVYGASLATEKWSAEPRVITGAGRSFSPVTALTVSDASGLTLTWTNPTSTYWRGTLVLRRTDQYPVGPDDIAATTIYDGRNATVVDTALTVGDTGYYSAFSYSRTRYGIPDQVSDTKV